MTQKVADDGWMDIEDAVKYVMRVKRCSGRAARRYLAKRMSSGDIRSSGVNEETGRRETIPPEAWAEALSLMPGNEH